MGGYFAQPKTQLTTKTTSAALNHKAMWLITAKVSLSSALIILGEVPTHVSSPVAYESID